MMTTYLCVCGKPITTEAEVCSTCTNWVGQYLSTESAIQRAKRNKVKLSEPATKIDTKTKEQ